MTYTPEQKFFQLLLRVYVWLLKQAYGIDNINQIGEIKLMANYIVKTDNPDVGFELIVEGVTDSEGNPIPDPQGLVKTIQSTDDSVVQFIPGETDSVGQVHFGNPGQASLEYSVADAEGNVLGSGSDGFTLTVGDPAAISSISATFEGLTPVEEPPIDPEA